MTDWPLAADETSRVEYPLYRVGDIPTGRGQWALLAVEEISRAHLILHRRSVFWLPSAGQAAVEYHVSLHDLTIHPSIRRIHPSCVFAAWQHGMVRREET